MEPTLQYSCCNEDAQSEVDALALPGRRVVCIAAAGERAFGLLLGDPAAVVAIDRNPAQIYLAQLKAAAMRRLDREAYLAFVGITESGGRMAVYLASRADLPEQARNWWDVLGREIEAGILHMGRCERGLARVAPLLRNLLARPIARLRGCATVEEQAAVARDLLDRRAVRAVLGLLFNPITGRLLLRDPVWYGDARRFASGYIRERLLTTLSNHRMDDCFILSLFLNGHLKGSPALPLDLTEQNYPIVKSRLDRIRYEISDITQYLCAQPAGAIDAFSLSDLGGYLTSDEYTTLLSEVQRVASDGATICIREFISQPTKKARWPSTLVRGPDLEGRLDRSDRSVGCTFVCATKEAAIGQA